ncbi:MAG: multiprotein bridging factor aMBF1 [Candidatus Nezhaarchaeales archaeon]
MQCEVCGKSIRGPPKKVIIDAVSLFVCNTCARYGVHVPRRKSAITFRFAKPAATKAPANIEQRFEVIPNFGAAIRRAREELGLTQEVLAGLVGEKLSVIKRIEAGKLKPTTELARKIEKALRIKLIEEPRSVSEGTQRPESRINLTLGDIVIIKDEKEEGTSGRGQRIHRLKES